jgi:hypothetical protein
VSVGQSDGGQPLKSWVRTLNEVEGMLLLDIARPGMLLEIWRQEAHVVLTQATSSYRTLLINLVERVLLDTDGKRILGSPYLSTFQSGWPQLRAQLFLARYGLAHPWTALAAHEILAPARLASDEPIVALAEFDALVARHIDPKIGESSRKKTRSTVVGLLKKLGCLEATGSTRAPLKVCSILPAPLVFGWSVGAQFLIDPTPRSIRWSSRSSNAAALFGPPPEYARRCVEAAVSAGMIARVEGSVEVCAAS